MANILYGNIEILDGTPVGDGVVVLSGEKSVGRCPRSHSSSRRVQLKVLKGGQ